MTEITMEILSSDVKSSDWVRLYSMKIIKELQNEHLVDKLKVKRWRKWAIEFGEAYETIWKLN